MKNSPKVPGKKVFRAWKGYLFHVLNELERDRLIRQFRNSLVLTDKWLKYYIPQNTQKYTEK